MNRKNKANTCTGAMTAQGPPSNCSNAERSASLNTKPVERNSEHKPESMSQVSAWQFITIYNWASSQGEVTWSWHWSSLLTTADFKMQVMDVYPLNRDSTLKI